MKKSIATWLVTFAGIGVILFVLLKMNPLDPIPAIVVAIAINLISSPIYVGIVESLYRINQIPLVFKTQLVYRNRDVRISISYLFRIKSHGKFLLVKNRKSNYYQLVGGAYKTLPGAEKIFKKYNVKPDNRFETEHGIAKNDLRFRLPGKNVLRIIDWFYSKEDRETSQWREFCEELITSNIISDKSDKHSFRYIDYRYVTTIQTPIQKAKNLGCQEILIYEIFDLVANNDQQKVLDQLYLTGNTTEVVWADEVIINSLGFDIRNKEPKFDIGAHTKWAINEKYTKE